MIDRPDNGINTGLFGQWGPLKPGGNMGADTPGPTQPRSSVVRLPLGFPVVGNRRDLGRAGGTIKLQGSAVTQ